MRNALNRRLCTSAIFILLYSIISCQKKIDREASTNGNVVTSYALGDTIIGPDGRRMVIHEICRYDTTFLDSIGVPTDPEFPPDTVPQVPVDTVPDPVQLPTIFAGSSSMSPSFWPELESVFADFNPVRKAYSGKTWGHLQTYCDTAFVPVGPKQIVIWCGENDWYDTYTRHVKFTEGDYNYRVKTTINKFRKLMPNAWITVIECKRTPVLQELWPSIDTCNAYVRTYLANMPNTSFIEINDLLVPPDYRSDGMHLVHGAYPKVAERIRPYLISN